MTDTLDRMLRDAAPISDAEVRDLQLDTLETELRESILLHGERESRAPAPERRSRWRLPALATAAVAAAALLAVAITGGGDTSDRAWAAPALKVANEVPRLLVGEPGWKITRADQFTVDDGEMTFGNGRRRVDLFWTESRPGPWIKDRAASADRLAPAEVLGRPATLFRYSAEHGDYTALWSVGRHTLELRSTKLTQAEFRGVLGSLRIAGVDRWLGAMPPSVVLPADSDAVVDSMLKDIPQPDGFSRDDLDLGDGVLDRYHVGARVAGGVACRWIELWVEAREDGDAGAAREAENAMRTARSWPILREMNAEGDYPEVLWGLAGAMTGKPRFKWASPDWLEDNYRSGLGC